jgi:hypothetical protein
MSEEILVISHWPQLVWYGMFAAELKKSRAIRSTLVVHGEHDRRRAEEMGVCDSVINILDGFDPAGAPQRYAGNLEILADFERRYPEAQVMRDAMVDRNLRGRFSREWTVAYLAHVVERLEQIYREHEPLATIMEPTAACTRIAYRFAKPATCLTPIALRYFDRFFLEDDLDWRWKKCRDSYWRFLNDGIPEDLRAIVEPVYEGICGKSQQPFYMAGYRGWRRGPEPLRLKWNPARLRGHWDYWRGDMRRDGRRNPRQRLIREALPTATLKRIVVERFRRRKFERVAITEIPAERRIATYFLHFQPEYTSDCLGLSYYDQTELVRNIAASLPADITLLVKEQPLMVGKRPIDYYRKLNKIPNVQVISDTVHSHRLIRRSDVVFTIVGTPALEAMFLGTPAIVFGPVHYDSFQGIYRASGYDSLPQLIRHVLDAPPEASRQSALAALAAEYVSSFPGSFRDSLLEPDAMPAWNQTLLGEGLDKELVGRGILPAPVGQVRL